MKIHVGSQNITKVTAVRNAVVLYPAIFTDPEVIGIDVQVDLHGHPKNMLQTMSGAKQRACNAFSDDCTYSIGLEGGLMSTLGSQSSYMEVGACAIYDGARYYTGLSPAFEWPAIVLKMILRDQGDASDIFYSLGITEHEKLGSEPGGISGFLTEGLMNREEFTKYSIMMAMVQLQNPQLYGI